MRGIYHGGSRNRDLFCSKECFKCSMLNIWFQCRNVVFIVLLVLVFRSW